MSHPGPPLVALALACAACSPLYPRVIGASPREPLFHSSPLLGGRQLDAAFCSMATAGPDAVASVSPPEPLGPGLPVARACAGVPADTPDQRGRVGRLVHLDTPLGPLRGYLYGVERPRGLLVAFAGLGMPPAGWIDERLAEAAAHRGLATFVPVREETERPMRFDPLWEARRALAAVEQLRADCRVDAAGPLGFAGVSMGGLEALLAAREARRSGLAARAAVLDPVLDIAAVTAHLDGAWHSLQTDSMQDYLRRLLRGRYGEPEDVTFGEVMRRTRPGAGSLTDPAADSPAAWLCGAEPGAYTVLVSQTDTVLGDEQRAFAHGCGFPLTTVPAPGHVPLACLPGLLEDLVEALDAPAQDRSPRS